MLSTSTSSTEIGYPKWPQSRTFAIALYASTVAVRASGYSRGLPIRSAVSTEGWEGDGTVEVLAARAPRGKYDSPADDQRWFTKPANPAYDADMLVSLPLPPAATGVVDHQSRCAVVMCGNDDDGDIVQPRSCRANGCSYHRKCLDRQVRDVVVEWRWPSVRSGACCVRCVRVFGRGGPVKRRVVQLHGTTETRDGSVD